MDNVRCYHDMLKYLSEITGLSYYVEVDVPNINEVKSFNHRLHFILNEVDIGYLMKPQIKGGSWILYSPISSLELPYDTKFDRIYYNVLRPMTDYPIKPEPYGKYKDSLGGGWYQTVQQYKVNDKVFAMMECSCF